VEAVLVTEGKVVEEIFDGMDAALGEVGADALTDAFDEFDGSGERERHGSMVAAKVLRKRVCWRGAACGGIQME
jgi:hypothetical protein